MILYKYNFAASYLNVVLHNNSACRGCLLLFPFQANIHIAAKMEKVLDS